MRKLSIILFSFFISCIVSCEDKNIEHQLTVLNDVFLEVADTTAYKELSLRPLPPIGYRGTAEHDVERMRLGIIIPDTLYPIQNWKNDLMPYCRGTYLDILSTLRDLKEELCSILNSSSSSKSFQSGKINNTGKFVVLSNASNKKEDLIFVGKIQFSQVIISKDKNSAVFMAIFHNTSKSAAEEFFIALREENKWTIYKKERFAIW